MRQRDSHIRLRARGIFSCVASIKRPAGTRLVAAKTNAPKADVLPAPLAASAVEALGNAGHDVVWVRTDLPGSSDHDLLRCAVRDERVVLTFDKDFGELA